MKISRADTELIEKIADRAASLAADVWAEKVSKLDIVIDLLVAHGSQPLRLADLLAAVDFDLVHDVFGINRYLDHATGLCVGFSPRFASLSPAKSVPDLKDILP